MGDKTHQLYRIATTPNAELVALTQPTLRARQPAWMPLRESAWNPLILLLLAVALMEAGLRFARVSYNGPLIETKKEMIS